MSQSESIAALLCEALTEEFRALGLSAYCEVPPEESEEAFAHVHIDGLGGKSITLTVVGRLLLYSYFGLGLRSRAARWDHFANRYREWRFDLNVPDCLERVVRLVKREILEEIGFGAYTLAQKLEMFERGRKYDPVEYCFGRPYYLVGL